MSIAHIFAKAANRLKDRHGNEFCACATCQGCRRMASFMRMPKEARGSEAAAVEWIFQNCKPCYCKGSSLLEPLNEQEGDED